MSLENASEVMTIWHFKIRL